jgi:hypothetical protein
VPVAGGVEASPLPDIASVPPGQILGAAGDCMPAAREHANSTFPWARLKKNSPANACGGQGLRRRLRRAFLGTFSRFPLFSSPENPSFGDHKLGKECVKAKLLACIAWRHAVSERRASEEGPHKPATLLAVSAGTDVPLQGSGKLETEAICWRYAASTRLLSGWPRLAP